MVVLLLSTRLMNFCQSYTASVYKRPATFVCTVQCQNFSSLTLSRALFLKKKMAEPDVAVPILVPDQPCLYEVDISKLFIDENLNRSLCLVYLEGPIPDSIQENENVGESIAQTFAYFPRLKSKNLVGAQIVHLFAAEDPLISPRKKWIKLHYLGAYIDLTVNAVTRWEGYSFFLLFVMNLKGEIYSPVMFKPLNDYELEISGNDENCSVPNLAENSRIIFVRQLSLHLRTLDHEVALRLLESFSRMIHAKKLPRVNKLWQGRDRERVDDFIRFPGKLEKLELVTDLMCDLASSYFTGKLPIELNCRMMNKSVCSLCCKIRLTYFRYI
ncbi:hypothetical protein JCGZ_18606 [Jatropha curcas]|uniref:Uncharacterized protein n=1 Tax=Jatropha curcas TaxID=180498 RepID=A0A067KCR3_JATCU|nr:hypothetical protein JCGZ_18606 [Jatropha curcas]